MCCGWESVFLQGDLDHSLSLGKLGLAADVREFTFRGQFRCYLESVILFLFTDTENIKMKKILALLLFVQWIASPVMAAGNYVYGKIAEVKSVNEIVVEGSYLQHQGKFRMFLNGVMAPEGKEMQQQASEFLGKMVKNLPVRASLIRKERDAKGEVYIVRLYIKEGNRWHRVEPDLLREGMAAVDTNVSNVNYLAAMEGLAKKEKKGMWKGEAITKRAQIAKR